MSPRVASSLLMVMLMVMVATLLAPRPAQAKVTYKCVYGPLRSTRDASGTTHHFCTTEMSPPFMQQGAYVIARDRAGTCYECVCEQQNDIGMACCETRCPRT